jgi:type VI protein secretion system component Hcp
MGNAYYLKLGSGNDHIVGGSRDRYHVGWIKLIGFYPAAQTGMGAHGTGMGAGKAAISQFELSKFEDISSPRLFVAASEGRHFRTAELEIADERTGIPKLRISFTDVMLGPYSANPNAGPDDPGPSETFTLSCAELTYNYNPIPQENAADILMSIFKTLGLAPVQ